MEPEEQQKRYLTIEELLERRTDDQVTIEATVDTGFEFLAIDECRTKFGENLLLVKYRGSIVFNINIAEYSLVTQLRSVDNLYLVVSYTPSIGLTGSNTDEDLKIAKMQAHVPNWDHWLEVWCKLSKFEGITKPTLEQFTAANERASKDKEAEKARQAERQQKHKERQQRNAERRAQRLARDAMLKERTALQAGASEDSTKSTDTEEVNGIKNAQESNAEVEEPAVEVDHEKESQDGDLINSDEAACKKSEQASNDDDPEDRANAKDPAVVKDELVMAMEDVDVRSEIESLPDYERDAEKEIAADIPPAERVLRFRATCFRVGKHSFKSMEAAREFGGELQDKFHWVVDLVNFHAEVVLCLHEDAAQVSIALTKRSLHRRNISYFGPTTLRSTVCHNLLRLAEVQPGEVVLDPLAGGGSIPIEGAMSFPSSFHFGGDINVRAMSRSYSNTRQLQQSLGRSLPIDALRWDSRRLPLQDGSVDVVVSDLPFGVRMGTKPSNRNLYTRVLLELARVVRPNIGRAILLTQDRKSFGLALSRTFGLWWQSRVFATNIGGLDAAVFTLRRTAKDYPEEAARFAEPQKVSGDWQGHSQNNRGWKAPHRSSWGRGRGRGGGRGRGHGSSHGSNWRN